LTDTRDYTKHDESSLFSYEELQTDPILVYFSFAHLKPELQAASKPWASLALHVITTVPRNPERTVALRKLLEGKDAAVRASLQIKTEPTPL